MEGEVIADLPGSKGGHSDEGEQPLSLATEGRHERGLGQQHREFSMIFCEFR